MAQTGSRLPEGFSHNNHKTEKSFTYFEGWGLRHSFCVSSSGAFHQLGPTGPSWSVSRHVRVYVCMSVPSRNTHFRRSCRPLVEDRVPYIGLE